MAEEEIRESERKYRELYETIKDGILAMDLEGNILEFNKAFLGIIESPATEIKNKNILNIVPKEWRKMKDKIADQLKARGYSNEYEIGFTKKDGTVSYVSVRVWSRKDKEGKPVGTWAIIRDITERKEAEEALRESEEKFRNLSEQSPNMIFINKKGRVVYVNKRSEEIMGYKRGEFYSPDFNFFTLIAPESIGLVKKFFSRHMRGKEVAPYEYTLITKGGKRIEAILTTKLIQYEGERAILGTVTDITERKRQKNNK